MFHATSGEGVLYAQGCRRGGVEDGRFERPCQDRHGKYETRGTEGEPPRLDVENLSLFQHVALLHANCARGGGVRVLTWISAAQPATPPASRLHFWATRFLWWPVVRSHQAGRAKLIGWRPPTVLGAVCCDWPTDSWRYANSSGRYISCRAPPENLSSLFLADFGIPSQTLIPPSSSAAPRLPPAPPLLLSASHKKYKTKKLKN